MWQGARGLALGHSGVESIRHTAGTSRFRDALNSSVSVLFRFFRFWHLSLQLCLGQLLRLTTCSVGGWRLAVAEETAFRRLHVLSSTAGWRAQSRAESFQFPAFSFNALLAVDKNARDSPGNWAKKNITKLNWKQISKHTNLEFKKLKNARACAFFGEHWDSNYNYKLNIYLKYIYIYFFIDFFVFFINHIHCSKCWVWVCVWCVMCSVVGQL